MAPMAIVFDASIMPYALKMIIDKTTHFHGDRGNIFSELQIPLMIYFFSWLTMTVIFRIQHWICTSFVPYFNADIRMTVFNYVKGHSHAYFSNNFAGSIANKIGDLPRSAINLFNSLRWQIITTTSVITATLIISSTINLLFTILILIWVTTQLGMAYYFARRISNFSEIYANNLSTLVGKIVDVLSNIANLRLFARAKHEGEYVGKYQDITGKSFVRTEVEYWKMTLLIEIPTFIILCTIFYFLVYGWQHGWVSNGDFVLILFMVSSVWHHVWHLSVELANIFKEIGICQQALSIVSEDHSVAEAPNATKLKVKKGEIVFDNVKFHYVEGKEIFRNKSIKINPGEKIGLVGFSGSGKSTFVNLILRLYDVDSGRILIDGQDISKVTQDSLRANIAMIPQDASLFHRTLMENIRYGRLEASDKEVFEAAKKANCHDFIRELEKGYDSLVGERGVKLSGGQRQRIAIARAILKDAPILILDEATSSLDSVTEKKIQQSLNKLMKNRTTIIIAHRLSTLSSVDRILVFDNGKIIEDGSHSKLIKKKNGHYARMWKMQAGGFLPEI